MPNFSVMPSCTLNPTGLAPLTAALKYETDIVCSAVLEVSGGGDDWRRALEPSDGLASVVPVLGLKAETAYEITLTLCDDSGAPSGEAFMDLVETGPLPEDFPVFNIRTCIPERREPGLILFALRNAGAAESGPGNGRIVAINEKAEVVWIFNAGGNLADFRRLQNGNIMYVTRGAIVEVDMLGQEVGRWSSPAVGSRGTEGGGIELSVQGIHHAAMELPNGNFFAIGTEMRRFDAYPTSETDPDAPKAPADVKGDVIVEFDRSGKIVNEINLFDILDTERICYYSVKSGEGGGPGGDGDWSHSNGLDYDPSDDSFILSIRHQDAVAKIGRTTGALKWIVGDHTGWGAAWQKYLLTPEGDVEWPFHQHDPSFTKAGTILCFDNGNCRAVPFNPRMAPADSYSRLVEYEVDESKRTVKQVWAFGGDKGEKIYASSQGGAIALPKTDNVFGDFACCRFDGDGQPSESNRGDARRTARLIEVTHDAAPEVLFDLELCDRSEVAKDFSSFRAIHLPGLYP